MTDIVERLRLMLACDPGCEGRCYDCPTSIAADAAAEIERLRAERDAAYKIGGEEALLYALHPEFGSIYDDDGEATAAYKAGQREGIEATARIIEARAYECVVDAAAWQRDVPEGRGARLLMESRARTLENAAAAIRALLEDDND